MNIDKISSMGYNRGWFYYYYIDSKTGNGITHGLYSHEWWGVCYHYHGIQIGFSLRKIRK